MADAATGSVDTSIYGRVTNPLDQYNKIIETQRNSTALDTEKLALTQKKLNNLQSWLGTLALKKDLTIQDIHDVAAKGVASGMWTARDAATHLANVPTTPDGLREYVTQELGNTMSAQEKFNAAYGTPNWLNNGSNQFPVSTSPLTGVRSLGPPLPNTMTPSEANIPTQTGMTPQGVPVMGTRNQYIERATGAPPPGFPSQMQPQQPGAPMPLPTQGMPSPGAPQPGYPVPTPQPRPQATPSPGLPASPAVGPTTGGVPMGLPIGRPEAMQANAKAGTDLANNMLSELDTSPQRKALLSNLDGLLDQFTSGPAADWKRVAASAVNSNLPVPKGWELFDPKKIASQEEFNKLALQFAQQQFKAIGGTGTDSKFSSAFETSPNEALTKMGNKNIIAMLRGNEDALAAKANEWNKWQSTHGPETYREFTSDFNKRYDPRVFQFVYMTPDNRREMIKSMNDRDRAAFVGRLRQAQTDQWVTPNAGQ